MSTNTIWFTEHGQLHIYGIDSNNTVAFKIELPYNRSFDFCYFSRMIRDRFGGESLYTRPISQEGRFVEIVFTMVCMGHEIRNSRGLLRAVRHQLVEIFKQVEEFQAKQSTEFHEMLSKIGKSVDAGS